MIGINEVGLYEIKIDFGKMETCSTNNVVYTENDFNTAKIKAELVKNEEVIDLTNVKVKIKIMTSSGATMEHDVSVLDIENGLIEYTFPENSLYEGINYFQLILIKDKQIKLSPKLSYKILDVIDDSGVLLEPNYPILIQLVDEVEKLKENTKEFLETSKTNEDTRVKNEEIRVKQENDRQLFIKNTQDVFNDKIKEVDSVKNKLVQDVDEKINDVDNTKFQLINDVQESKTKMLDELSTSKNQMESTVTNKVIEFENKFKELKNQDVVSEIDKARGKYSDLNDRLDNLDKDLLKAKDMTTIPVVTENSFITVEDTIDGYFENIKLEGRTLVNRLGQKELDKMGRTYSYDNSSKTLTNNNGVDNTSWTDVPSVLDNLVVGREYTFIYEGVTDQTEIQICSESLSVKYLPSVNKGERKVYKFLADGTQFKLKVFGNSSVSISNIMLIEGNLSKNPPNTHFEGIKSVGDNTDRLEIISSKGRVISFEQGSLHSGNATLVPSSTRITSKEFSKSNDGYTDIVGIDTSKYQIIIFDFDENFNYLGDYGLREWSRETRVKLLPNARYYKFCVKINDESNIKPNEFKTIITTGKRDIKNILYKDKDNTWKKPILREWDSIEKHSDGKYYYHKRSEQRSYQTNDETDRNVITDKTNTVYKLEIEKVYECTPIDLIAYENETNCIIEFSPVNPKTTLKCVNYIGNVINTLKEKVSYLEDKLYKTNLANFTVALNALDTKLKLEQLTKTPK